MLVKKYLKCSVITLFAATLLSATYDDAAWTPKQKTYPLHLIKLLTQWGQEKTDAISQTTFSSVFSWMKTIDFRSKFHWSLILRVQLKLSSIGSENGYVASSRQAKSLNQWYLVYGVNRPHWVKWYVVVITSIHINFILNTKCLTVYCPIDTLDIVWFRWLPVTSLEWEWWTCGHLKISSVNAHIPKRGHNLRPRFTSTIYHLCN